MQYSYNDGDLYYFMDMETYDIHAAQQRSSLPDSFKFVKEEMMCKLVSYKGKVFNVEPPTFVELAGYRHRSRFCRQHRNQHSQARNS